MKSPGLFWLGQTMKLPFWPSFRSSSSACRPVAYAWNHLHGNDPKNDRHQQKGHDQGNPPSRILTFRWPSRSCKVKLFSLCTLMKSTILSGVADCFLIAAFACILLYVCMWWLRSKPRQLNDHSFCKGIRCSPYYFLQEMRRTPNRVKVSTTRIWGFTPNCECNIGKV